jgi:hypothetical protein
MLKKAAAGLPHSKKFFLPKKDYSNGATRFKENTGAARCLTANFLELGSLESGAFFDAGFSGKGEGALGILESGIRYTSAEHGLESVLGSFNQLV